MIRFVDLAPALDDSRLFALFDTVVGRFVDANGTQAWMDLDELADDLRAGGPGDVERLLAAARGGLADRGSLVLHPSIVAVQVRGPITLQNPIQEFDTIVVDEGNTLTWIGDADRDAMVGVLVAIRGSEVADVRGKP